MSMNIKDEALAARALDGDTRSVYDFPNVDFWGLCEEHLKHAREKHPEFVEQVSPWGAEDDWYDELALKRKQLSIEKPSVEHVLMSEVYEFLAEAKRGNMERAQEEAADVVAVLKRVVDGDHLKEGGNQ